MTNHKISSGWFPISTAVLMLVFWILYAVFLPMQEPYVNWVLDSDWTWVNVIGFVGSLMGIFALNSVYSVLNSEKTSDYIGYTIGISGVVILTAILFFEAFILKGIAIQSPEIINLNSGFYQENSFKIANLSGGLLLTIGALILGVSMVKRKIFKRWKVVMFMIACPTFGIVIMPGNVRLLGVLLYSISLIAIGVEMNKKTDANKT
ncbi:hypothetical protein [Seonamhaeicola aphaedonensis]|uniref:DUF998 domain-containing protein n=1 Tax=Seonamhaeicola aphaedonensis TaxID=1461338 RepID=A0A3D9H3M7_9FLAO|nr:hypothetical protein [Seonamhaeicola aphaedonensis]RED43811.1 hypothetical protein DFQ02_1251 [Seonamhaeicola aphaedonensis]